MSSVAEGLKHSSKRGLAPLGATIAIIVGVVTNDFVQLVKLDDGRVVEVWNYYQDQCAVVEFMTHSAAISPTLNEPPGRASIVAHRVGETSAMLE